jgi:hypothetical protein
MNERLKELADEAGLFWQYSPAYEKCLERFAELIRADEREACAKLCESEGHRIDASWESCAIAIRQRGEK